LADQQVVSDRRRLIVRSEKSQVGAHGGETRSLAEERNFARGFESSSQRLANMAYKLLKWNHFFDALAEREGFASKNVTDCSV
jgi:hypothetical protein